MNKYDDTNYIYNAADDGIYTEQELKKKFTAQDNYKLLKSVANNQEKKQFRDIERKYKKKKLIDQRTAPFRKKDDTDSAVNIDINLPKQLEFNSKPVAKYELPKKELAGLAYLLGVDDV